MSILLLIEYSLEVASGKGFCKDLDKDYYRVGRLQGCWKAARDRGVEREPKIQHWVHFLFHQREMEIDIQNRWTKSSDLERKFSLYRFGFWFSPWLCLVFGDQM